MKFGVHFSVQVVLFGVVGFWLGVQAATLIVLFHFIPSFDFLMKKLNVRPDLHRKLTHNLLVAALALVIVFEFAPPLWAALAGSNLLLHLLMDCQGAGVELLYPFSERRFRLF